MISTSRHWILAKKPVDHPVFSGPDATFRLVTKSVQPLEEEQVLLKVLYLSNEPAQRLWIDPSIEPDRLYTEPVEVGDTMKSYASICEVVESKSKNLPVGTLVSSMTGWCEYAVTSANECMPLKPIDNLPLTHYSGIFGTAGVTAYYGLVDIVNAGPGDTVVISAAAGAVGSAAVQIAKNLLGCKRVIGIAGTDAKCRWVETLGADVCLNYKSAAFKEDLKKATEVFVEVFVDNVGGEILDLVLTLVAKGGRVAACGAIADYNNSTPIGIKNWYHVIAMRLQIRGFVVTDLTPGKWGEIINALLQGYRKGQIKATEYGQTIVPTTFDDVPKTWMRLFSSETTGKLLTRLV
jgi:NADPH-dependent curcumin reductase CurA